MLDRIVLLVAVAWAGSLWTICGMVAPTLFAILDDRALAGRIAGTFFALISWVGFAAAALVFAVNMLQRRRRDRWLTFWTVTAGLLPVASELLLTPQMQVARASADMQRFGALHGVSAALFGLACVAVLGVLLRLTRPAT